MKHPAHILEMEISGIRKCFDAAGEGAINLSIGQPDFQTPPHVKEAAIRAIEEGFTGYTPNLGTIELVEAIRQKFQQENGLVYDPQEIMVTSGASEALFLAVASTTGPGDEVLLPDPGFLSYASLTKAVGGRPISVPLDQDLKIDPNLVQEMINPRTRAIIVNSPSNPTGAIQSREELKALAEMADDADIALISDEVYEHFIYEGEHVSPARFSENVITVNAVSKTYSMTGWRLGYLGASQEAMESMFKIHQYIQACASSISQAAALAALTGPQDCVIHMRDQFRSRRDVMVQAMRDMGVDMVVPKGAFYLFPRVGDGDEVSIRLSQAGVITVPGSTFGKYGRPYLRISYAASLENILRALERMRRVL